MFVLHVLLTEFSVESHKAPRALFSPHFLVTWTSYCAAAPSPPILSLCSMFRGVSAAEVLHEVDFSNPVCEKEIMSEFPSESVRLLCSAPCDLSSFISQDSLQQTKGHWFILTACSPSLSFSFLFFFPTCSQTYQQSSSLQSKTRKKNRGKQRRHLFVFFFFAGRSCRHSPSLALPRPFIRSLALWGTSS